MWFPHLTMRKWVENKAISGASQVALVVKKQKKKKQKKKTKTKKKNTCQLRRLKRCGFNPWVRKTPGAEQGNPLQYSCLENPVDRGVW